jgi:asparagine synthase (glutamine-hydrolysing)
MTRVDFHTYLPDDILVKVDRASMLTSLEARAPLLDYRIAEFAFHLPDQLRINGSTRKYLLKKVARKYLPPNFQYERKQGFSVPEAEWFQGPWRDLLVRVLPHSKFLDPTRVRGMLDLHQRSPRYGRALFRALMLAQFERIWAATP